MIRIRASIAVALIVAFALLSSPTGFGQQESPPAQDTSLRNQLGNIIVTPGNGPNLALADFVARSAGTEAATATFNEVLLADLDFAAVAGLVGKSLNPKTLVPDPASLKFEEWSADPAKADYVAFGNLQGAGGLAADCYLYDVKTKQQLIASRHSGDARRMAHEFADEIVKLLTGREGIATSKIAYVGGDVIRVSDYDGFNARTFASDGPLLRFPQFSPDGRYLAYVSYKSGVPNIVVRSADGGLIGGTHFNATTTSPTISPSGQLAFSSAISNDGSMEIYVANLDGSNARRLTRTAKGINISPRWNPKTGREIAYISSRGGSPQVYVMSASGVGAKRVTFQGKYNQTPRFCPRSDKQLLAFTGRDEKGAFDVFILDLKTNRIDRIVAQGKGSNLDPAWSPDGRLLAYTSSRGGIFIYNPETRHEVQVWKGGASSPTWGPAPRR